MRGKLNKKFKKINFGSGYDKRVDYLNVDVDPVCEPDLLIKDNDYSVIPKNHYTEILANDVLEHIPHSQTLSVLLDWSEFLKPNGKLHIQTSSILGVADQLRKNNKFENQVGWTVCLFGNQAHPGDFHHVGFTEATLKTNLLAAGYKIDNFTLKDLWLFHVDCRKVTDWAVFIEDHKKDNNDAFTHAVFNYALGREPDGMGGTHIIDNLENGSLTRKAALKHLLSSKERLYYVAKENQL